MLLQEDRAPCSLLRTAFHRGFCYCFSKTEQCGHLPSWKLLAGKQSITLGGNACPVTEIRQSWQGQLHGAKRCLDPHFYSFTEQEQQSCCQEAQTAALAPAPQCRDTRRQQGQDYCSDQQLSEAGAILLSCLRFPYFAWCNLMLKKQMLFNSPPSSDGQW